MGYSRSTGCVTPREMSWAHLTHLEPCARFGHKGNSDWASKLMEGSLSTYGKGGSVSIAMDFGSQTKIKFSISSNLFLPSVCKSHNLCPAYSSLQHPEALGSGLRLSVLWLFLSLSLSAMQSQEKLSLVLGCLSGCVSVWIFSLTFSLSVDPLFTGCTIPNLVQDTTCQISVRSARWTHPHSCLYGEKEVIKLLQNRLNRSHYFPSRHCWVIMICL